MSDVTIAVIRAMIWAVKLKRLAGLYAICYLAVMIWWYGRKEKKARAKSIRIPVFSKAPYLTENFLSERREQTLGRIGWLFFLLTAAALLGLTCCAFVAWH